MTPESQTTLIAAIAAFIIALPGLITAWIAAWARKENNAAMKSLTAKVDAGAVAQADMTDKMNDVTAAVTQNPSVVVVSPVESEVKK